MHKAISTSAFGCVAGLAVGLLFGACTYEIPRHCSNLDGDATCRERGQGEFCSACELANDGCSDVRPGVDCHFVGEPIEDSTSSGSSGGSGTEGTTDGTSDSGTDPSTSSGATSTTGDVPCMGNEDCTDAAAPFCDPAGECVDCGSLPDGGAACAEADPEHPICDAGACVACTAADIGACGGTTPLCDVETNTCVPCTEHAQCGDAACNLFTGACLPMDAVVHVGTGQAFTSINAAVASFGVGAEGTIIVHAGPNFDEAVTVGGGRTLAFLANQIGPAVQPPRWILGAGGSPQLIVGNATVLMDGIQFSGNASSADAGVRIDGGQVWLDRSRVVTNLGGGILAQSAAELVLRNCFVGGLGDVIGVEIESATATILYSTITASTFASTPAVGCTSPVSVDIRNSIVVSQGGTSPDELSCAGASVTNTVTEANAGSTFNAAWFQNFNGGDYRLTTGGATPGAPIFADEAQWQDGDPPTDILGSARPMIDGAPDYAGAHVP